VNGASSVTAADSAAVDPDVNVKAVILAISSKLLFTLVFLD
jgi:hypothetical protein